MANTKVTGDLIASSTIATGNIADNAVTSDKISGITTAHITEGSNLYYTNARARGAVSVSGNALSYNSSTGVITSNFEESPTFTGAVNITGDLDIGATDGNNAVMKLSANTGNWVFTNVQSSRNLEISDSDGTGTVMVINTSGNVAIGPNSPTSRLSISGLQAAIDITRGNSGDSKWEFSSDSTALYFSEMSTGTRAYMMTIKETTGNVGIGTTSPQHLLHLKSTISGPTGIIIENTNNAQSLDIDFWNNAGAAQGRIRYNEGAGSFDFFPNVGASSVMTMLYGGNVGIGTTSPGQKLVVTGNIGTSGSVLFDDNQGINFGNSNAKIYGSSSDGIKFNAGGSEGMRFNQSGNLGIGTTSPGRGLTIDKSNANAALEIIKNNTGNQIVYLGTGSSGGTDDPLLRMYHNTTENIRLYTTGDSWINGGNVGIGTTSPNARLDVSQASGATLIRLSNSDATLVDAGDIQARLLFAGRYYSGSGTQNVTSEIRQIKNNGNGYGGGAEMAFLTNDTERMRIGSSGKVDIASSTAAGALTITQSAEVTGNAMVYIDNNSASNKPALRIDVAAGGNSTDTHGVLINNNGPGYGLIVNGGNVGIGVTSPARKLDVAGEITHEGLVPKAGAFVDGLVTIDKTVSTTANTWTSLDISLSNIGGTGTFAVQVYSNAHGSTGAGWYSMYWSGIMSWHHTGVNDDDIDEIPLHMAGHARNNNTLELRTKLHTNDGTSYANRCELQIKTANTISSAPISFRFRKLL
jgi:hypothetical protein